MSACFYEPEIDDGSRTKYPREQIQVLHSEVVLLRERLDEVTATHPDESPR